LLSSKPLRKTPKYIDERSKGRSQEFLRNSLFTFFLAKRCDALVPKDEKEKREEEMKGKK